MKYIIWLFLYFALSYSVSGCQKTSKDESSALSQETDTTDIASIVDAQAVIEEVQPFKGVWVYTEEGDYQEENGLILGAYIVTLVLNPYEKNVYNGTDWTYGGFNVINDRRNGDYKITSFKINGNEADIQYESISTAICKAKLIYHPEDHSMTLIDKGVIDKNGIEDFMINEFQILRDKTELSFERKNIINAQYTNLEGTISNNKIRMCLPKDQNGENEIDGNYCYIKHNKSLGLRGTKENGVYTLNEMDNGNITATFTLKKKANGIWEGIWTDGIKTLPVKLRELDEL